MTTPLTPLLRPARAALLAERSDRELLDSFVRHRDEDAFADVVRRHGPMVLGVCRRVLRNYPDADDAFQAAFLVLARRAAHLASAEKLANWLHGVAFNTARKLRHANRRRSARESPLETDPPSRPSAPDDIVAALDEAVGRLPEKYRAVVVLCDLEGRTRSDAARTLGVPEGTVAGRLARARDQLRRSLADRGVIPVVVVAFVPNSLVKASARTAAGGVAPLRAAVLADGVISTMIHKKLFAGALVAAVIAGVGGVATFAGPQLPPPEPRFKFPGLGEARPAAEQAPKTLTAFPLRNLTPEKAVEALEKHAKAGAVLTPVPNDRTLLIYTDETTRQAIEDDLRKLNEERLQTATFRLKNTRAEAAARSLNEVYFGPKGARGNSRMVIAAVPDEGVLLVYATEKELATIRKLLGVMGEDVKAAAAAPEPTFTIEFRAVPWADVLDWYAKVSGLTSVVTARPTGNVTLKPGKDRKYTLAEVTDLLNEMLVQQKFLLVRGEKTFTLILTDEKLDPSLFRRVELADLPKLARTDLVEVTLPLPAALPVKEHAAEIEKMLGPFGQLGTVGGRNVVILRDTARNILRVQDNLRSPGKKD